MIFYNIHKIQYFSYAPKPDFSPDFSFVTNILYHLVYGDLQFPSDSLLQFRWQQIANPPEYRFISTT